MSGPYCEECKYFYMDMLSNESGECLDPSKIIYAKCGDRINEPPQVYIKNECQNWTSKIEQEQTK